MDRFNGIEQQEQDTDEAQAYAQFLADRQKWEQDAAAIAEYESWFLQKTMAEADAEFLDVR